MIMTNDLCGRTKQSAIAIIKYERVKREVVLFGLMMVWYWYGMILFSFWMDKANKKSVL